MEINFRECRYLNLRATGWELCAMQPLTYSLIDCGSWWTGLFAAKDSIGAPNEPLKSTRQPPQTLYAHLSCIRAQVGSCWLRLKLESAKEKEDRHWWRHSCSCCRRHPYGRFCRSCRHWNRFVIVIVVAVVVVIIVSVVVVVTKMGDVFNSN